MKKLRHQLAIFFLWIAHKFDRAWIDRLLNYERYRYHIGTDSGYNGESSFVLIQEDKKTGILTVIEDGYVKKED